MQNILRVTLLVPLLIGAAHAAHSAGARAGHIDDSVAKYIRDNWKNTGAALAQPEPPQHIWGKRAQSNRKDGAVGGAMLPADWKDFVGRLYFKAPDTTLHRCTAIFVAPQVLLTAAHCIRDYTKSADNVDFSFQLGDATTFHAVNCWTYPEDYLNNPDPA